MLPPGTLSLEGIKTHQQALLSHVDHAPLRSAEDRTGAAAELRAYLDAARDRLLSGGEA